MIKRVSPTPHEKPNYGTSLPNPLKIMKKNDSFEIFLDSRHLNSKTDHSSESWQPERLATQPARANKKYKSANDIM